MSADDMRAYLLRLRAEVDGMLAAMGGGAPAPVVTSRYAKIGDFAEQRSLSARTIRDYCDLGMPHIGEGRGRRVLVVEADAWIAAGGPRKARMTRKGEAA